MSEVHWLDASSTARLILRREVSACEVLEAYLARVRRFNPALNCIIALDEEGARERARKADAALADGLVWGPLHGVPMTVKDTFEVVGMPCTAGSRSLANHRPVRNATAVQRLLDAGAIPFGKTNVPEFASDLQTSNELHGTTNNAWHPDRTAGGSSGGSAVALAAGLTALELGSDLGGSSRVPAHYNGLFGMRPTWGLISTLGHIPGPPGSLVPLEFNCVGPMARSARDLRLVLDLTKGSDPVFGKSVDTVLPDDALPPQQQLRIATWMEHACGPVDHGVLAVLERALEALRRSGTAQWVEARPQIDWADAFRLLLSMLGAATAARKSPEQRAALKEQSAALGSDRLDAWACFVRGSQMSLAGYHEAMQKRNEARVRWAEFFRDHDALLTPVVGIAAREHGPNFFDRVVAVNGQPLLGRDHLFWASHQVLASLPAVVIPAGFTQEGLPVGLQITTGHCEDYKAIKLAERLSDVLGVSTHHPAAWMS